MSVLSKFDKTPHVPPLPESISQTERTWDYYNHLLRVTAMRFSVFFGPLFRRHILQV